MSIPEQIYVNDHDPESITKYLVSKIWNIVKHYPVETVKVSTLINNIDNVPMWRYPENSATGFNITIRDVLSDPKKYKYHYNRMLKADYSHPIIIVPNDDIADGNHRLGHVLIDEGEEILVKRIKSWSEIKSALIPLEKSELLSKVFNK